MIALALDGPDALAEAMYLAEITAAALAVGQPPRGNLWRDLDPEMRAVKVTAAQRLITLYRVEGLSMGLAEPE
jgi:hypothetical protein